MLVWQDSSDDSDQLRYRQCRSATHHRSASNIRHPWSSDICPNDWLHQWVHLTRPTHGLADSLTLESAYKSGFFAFGPWGSSLPKEIALGDQSGLSVGLTSSKRSGTGWTLETQAGLSDSHLSGDWSTGLLGVKVKIGATASGGGDISGFVDGEGKITSNVRGGVTVSADFGGGITMRLR
jgi:hypothetical protein